MKMSKPLTIKLLTNLPHFFFHLLTHFHIFSNIKKRVPTFLFFLIVSFILIRNLLLRIIGFGESFLLKLIFISLFLLLFYVLLLFILMKISRMQKNIRHMLAYFNLGLHYLNIRSQSINILIIFTKYSVIQSEFCNFIITFCFYDFIVYNNIIVFMGFAGKRLISKIIKGLKPQTFKILRLSLYILIIYAAHITTALLTQKIYKTPYLRNGSTKGETDFFTNPFGIPIVNGFFGLVYGFLLYDIFQHNNSYRQQKNNTYAKQFIKLAAIQSIIHIAINVIIILTSFTTVNLINCCNLLAVVLYGLLFGKKTEGSKIQKRHLIIAILITIGIVIFNIFSQHKHNDVNKPLNLFSGSLIIGLLLIEGYVPELITQIKDTHSPPPSLMYYEVSKYSLLFLIISSAITTQFFSLIKFIWEHDRLALDLTLVGVLDVTGVIFIYRLLVLQKQHVVPMIRTIRKLFTSLFNIWYFSHPIRSMQWIGIALVFAVVLVELYASYLENIQKFKQINQQEQEPNLYSI